MTTTLDAHQPNAETLKAAEREHANIVQYVVDAGTGKIKGRVPLIGGGGTLKRCREKIAKLQARHLSSGYNAEGGWWFAHDMPEGGLAPKVIYRWVLE